MDLRERPQGAFLRHPWETSRCRFFTRLLLQARSRRGSGALPAQILDAGAGDGFLASEVIQRFPPGTRISCWDAAYSDTELAALGALAPEGVSFRRDAPGDIFDVLLLLDVLEHVEDDKGFLTPLVRTQLAAGGIAIVSVPAWPSLFSEHDRELGHHRRYVPRDFHALLAECGLAIQERGGLFHSLVPLRMAERLADRLRGANSADGPSHEWPGGRGTVRLAEAILSVDNSISLLGARFGLALPGLSCWAVCEKLA